MTKDEANAWLKADGLPELNGLSESHIIAIVERLAECEERIEYSNREAARPKPDIICKEDGSFVPVTESGVKFLDGVKKTAS